MATAKPERTQVDDPVIHRQSSTGQAVGFEPQILPFTNPGEIRNPCSSQRFEKIRDLGFGGRWSIGTLALS
jgi:hypothetical protein